MRRSLHTYLPRPRCDVDGSNLHGIRPTIHWLHSRKAEDRLVVGGKAANLARLVALGFPVPNGFAIPVGADPARDPAWQGLLEKSLKKLKGPVAVRSSLVGEDDRTRSFAGQLETVLGVEGEEALFSAIEKVGASATDPQLRRYAEDSIQAEGRLGAAETEGSVVPLAEALKVAVLVQEMVPARAAGVAFSADPLTGRSTVVIEAVPRLGDDLVQGRAEPDRFIVDPRGALSLEDRKLLCSEDFPTEMVLELGRIVRRVASHAGIPQDVEWAWDGTQLFLLQARPITSFVGQNVYSRKLVGDMAPGPIKQLVWSTNTLGMVEGVFGDVFSDLIGPNNYDFSRILKRIRSRAFVNTTFVGRLLAEIGLPRNLFEAVAREEKLPKRFKLNRTMLTKAPRIATFMWRHAKIERELDERLRDHERGLQALRDLEVEKLDSSGLLREVESLLDLHGGLQWCIMMGSMNLGIRTRLLKRFVIRRVPGVDPSHLLVGLKGLKSVEPNLELQSIALEAEPLQDGLKELIATGSVDEVREGLAGDPHGSVILQRVDALLKRFRFLSANGTNFGEPTWEEEPGPVWRALGWMLQAGPADHPDPAGVRRKAREEVLQRLGAMDAWRFRRRLKKTERYLRLRESVSILMTEDTYLLRRLFLALGNRLTASDSVEDPADIFHLTLDEVKALVAGKADVDALRQAIKARRQELEQDRDAVLPETILGEEVPVYLPNEDGVSLITGIGASSGTVEGRARLVRTLEEAPAVLSRDDILVVPFSDVGWTPLFTTVGGIVAECGGQLSHTAIVAREYGLPAVVAARGAMQEIRDGQAIRVDGSSGSVHLLDSVPSKVPLPQP